MTEITLPSGLKVRIGAFLGKHIAEANRMAGGNADRLSLAMVAAAGVEEITGDMVAPARLFLEDLENLPGMDALELIGVVLGNGQSVQKA